MNGSFYESQGNNTLTINGLLSWADSAGVDYGLYLMVVNATTMEVKQRKLLEVFGGSIELAQRKYVISERLELGHMDNVLLNIYSDDTSEAIYVGFSTESSLQVNDKATDSNITSSECYGIKAYDAFKGLLDKMSGGTITLESSFFKEGKGANDFITNGNNIRGILSPVNLSFSWIFGQFKTLYDLEANYADGILRIEPAESASEKNSLPMGEVKYEFIEVTDIDRLFSNVKAGYRTWQSDSKLKGAEYNSVRNYETGLEFNSRELNLTLEVITSSYIIEEVRRIQFDTEKSRDGNKYDESVFLIATDGRTVEGVYLYPKTTNIVASGGVYNLKYTPATIVENNRRLLNNVGYVKFVSGEGNSVATVNGQREDRNFSFGEKMPQQVSFQLEMEPEQFEGLRYLEVTEGETTHYVKVLEAEMALQDTGLGVVDIIGEIA